MSDCWELLVGNLVAATVAECESHEQSESDAEKDAAADRFIRAKDSLLLAVRSIASAPQASQPPQGAEPAQFAEQDERGVWRTEDGFPSPENAWEAMLVARARSGHALSYSDTSRIILDLRRAALSAPPQGASSRLLPADTIEAVVERLVAEVWTWGESCGVDGVRMNEQGDSHNEWMRANAMKAKDALYAMLAASPLPAPQEPARPDILEKLTYHQHERDDLTLDECWEVLASGYRKVHGRTDRQMVMQILALLAAAPAPDSTP